MLFRSGAGVITTTIDANSTATVASLTVNTTASIGGNLTVGNVTGNSSNVQLVANTSVWTFDNTGNLVFPDGSKQNKAYINDNRSSFIIFGDGNNSMPHHEDNNPGDMWFDITCAGPNDTVFVAGGWSNSYNATIYQLSNIGEVLWSWMEQTGVDSVSAMYYSGNTLTVVIPGYRSEEHTSELQSH